MVYVRITFFLKKHGTNADPHNMRGLIPTNAKKKNILYFYEHHRNTGSAYLRNHHIHLTVDGYIVYH